MGQDEEASVFQPLGGISGRQAQLHGLLKTLALAFAQMAGQASRPGQWLPAKNAGVNGLAPIGLVA